MKRYVVQEKTVRDPLLRRVIGEKELKLVNNYLKSINISQSYYVFLLCITLPTALSHENSHSH